MNGPSDPTQADAVRPHRLYMVPVANKSTAEHCEVSIWALDTSAAIEAALRRVFREKRWRSTMVDPVEVREVNHGKD